MKIKILIIPVLFYTINILQCLNNIEKKDVAVRLVCTAALTDLNYESRKNNTLMVSRLYNHSDINLT